MPGASPQLSAVLAPFLLVIGLFTKVERVTVAAPVVFLLLGAGSVLWVLRCGARRRALLRETIAEYARRAGA
ncbi:hypothetical protein [Nesterenkonia ebinurensis]|uniref:hypothetical protein n=1 Tax=Nesterenkonia ebinurensis TaxID=2608252 RepID=UPI00123CB8A0|nr:hypothetical protein [Nesterenkonia ebinurensis]